MSRPLVGLEVNQIGAAYRFINTGALPIIVYNVIKVYKNGSKKIERHMLLNPGLCIMLDLNGMKGVKLDLTQMTFQPTEV